MNKSTVFIIGALVVLIAFTTGFFLGRGSIKTGEVVEYKRGETVYGSLNPDFLTQPVEFAGNVRNIPYYLWKSDTVVVSEIEYINTIPDTAEIVKDFLVKREYDFNVFDDQTTGKLDVSQTVQYNKLQSFDYSFTPIQKHTTVTLSRTFEPFVSVGYNTLNQPSVGGGVFIHNIGLEYNYTFGNEQYIQAQPFHGLSVKVKF